VVKDIENKKGSAGTEFENKNDRVNQFFWPNG